MIMDKVQISRVAVYVSTSVSAVFLRPLAVNGILETGTETGLRLPFLPRFPARFPARFCLHERPYH